MVCLMAEGSTSLEDRSQSQPKNRLPSFNPLQSIFLHIHRHYRFAPVQISLNLVQQGLGVMPLKTIALLQRPLSLRQAQETLQSLFQSRRSPGLSQLLLPQVPLQMARSAQLLQAPISFILNSKRAFLSEADFSRMASLPCASCWTRLSSFGILRVRYAPLWNNLSFSKLTKSAQNRSDGGAIDIRFKHIGVSEDSLLRQLAAPFTILTEGDHVLVTLEAASYSEMEEWIVLFEASALTFINRAVDSNIVPPPCASSFIIP